MRLFPITVLLAAGGNGAGLAQGPPSGTWLSRNKGRMPVFSKASQ